jgi:4-diphosphocytidyl-2-C-methyl-D-erythritol kinase
VLLSAEAPCKINRELRVGSRRADGYHEILSRFSSIDFADRLEVEDAPGLELTCAGLPVPGGESNLVWRAARMLSEWLGIRPRARIRLEKRVPTGAGLGGGSADAAVALVLLSRLWGSAVSREDIAGIAAGIGSDVPFFLFGGDADVSGRGERVAPREDAPQTGLLLCIPPFSIPTADVYAAFARRTAGASRLPAGLEIESTGNFLGPNDLASAVLEVRGEMGAYLHTASKAAREFTITGSGCAVVLCGVTAEGERLLAESHPEATLRRVRTLTRGEYRRRTTL